LVETFAKAGSEGNGLTREEITKRCNEFLFSDLWINARTEYDEAEALTALVLDELAIARGEKVA
jgi:hypothetical protein